MPEGVPDQARGRLLPLATTPKVRLQTGVALCGGMGSVTSRSSNRVSPDFRRARTLYTREGLDLGAIQHLVPPDRHRFHESGLDLLGSVLIALDHGLAFCNHPHLPVSSGEPVPYVPVFEFMLPMETAPGSERLRASLGNPTTLGA